MRLSHLGTVPTISTLLALPLLSESEDPSTAQNSSGSITTPVVPAAKSDDPLILRTSSYLAIRRARVLVAELEHHLRRRPASEIQAPAASGDHVESAPAQCLV